MNADPILAPPFDTLSALPRRRLSAMRRARRELFAVLGDYARVGGHPVRDVLAASPQAFTRGVRYPPDDVDDTRSGYAWYYHAHDASDALPWEEHGHFHLYCYARLLPAGARPLAQPADAVVTEDSVAHLLAISFDLSGAPARLFTLNRPVTGEWTYPAGDLLPIVERFALAADKPFAQTSCWLGAMLRLMQPQIAWLLHQRDRAWPDCPEVNSAIAFDLDAHLAALDRA